MKSYRRILFFVLLAMLACQSSASAETVFGPSEYVRTKGKPDVYHEAFSGQSGMGKIVVFNGHDSGRQKGLRAVRSARIHINGEEIFGPKDFSRNRPFLEAPIFLIENNSLRVELQSKPGSYLTVEIIQDISLPGIVEFSATPETIDPGGFSTLKWSTENAQSCDIEPGIGSVETSGSLAVAPEETTAFTLTAAGYGAAVSKDVTVTVSPLGPTASLSASPAIMPAGETAVLSWSSAGAGQAYIDHGIGAVPVSGTISVSPEATTVYTLFVTGDSGSAAASAHVEVSGNPEPLPEGSFGERYANLIPRDAVIHAYDPDRFSIVTGRVEDTNGAPLSEVMVSVHASPAYGSVRTDENGMFSMPVDGGESITLTFRKAGFIDAQRKIAVPWNDIAVLHSFKMAPQDPRSTAFSFDGSSETVVVHESTPVVDEFGGRSCTLVFKGDNQAYAVDENGNDMFELTTLMVRATEFATKDAMPAQLPPNSAYTYCVELSVDGVKNVRFEDPLIAWVDNFLGFEVGSAVPVGYYDRRQGVWVPADNGMVVALLDTDSDGLVDAVDADGDGSPDDINNNGSITDEARGLTQDPLRYPPGSTFWRIGVGHFSPWDCNWPYGPPPDAINPNYPGSPNIDQQHEEEKDCNDELNSYVQARSRIFHEDIPIPGTDLTLHYASNRVPGYKPSMILPVSGDQVPTSLKSIVANVTVDGKTYEKTLDPLPGEKVLFSWGDQDFMGKDSEGPAQISASVGFVYDALYYTPGEFDQAFGQFGNNVTGIRARQETVAWRNKNFVFDPPNRQTKNLADGWTISAHHYISSITANTLYTGDGRKLYDKYGNVIETIAGGGYIYGEGPALDVYFYCPGGMAVDALGNYFIADSCGYRIFKMDTSGNITSIAGNGTRGHSGDGGPATDAQIDRVYDITVDDQGDIYFAEPYTAAVRKVDKNGIISTVAGNGSPGCSGDGGPATEAQLLWPQTVAVDNLGNIYIGDSGNNRIRKIDPKGDVTTFFDFWSPDYTGPYVDWIADIALDSFGNFFISDPNEEQIVKLTNPSGDVERVAGVPNIRGFEGDGGPAVDALICDPQSLAVDPAGNIYFIDQGNERIRKIDTHGIIITVAGSGIRGCSGDGGPAALAQLDDPSGVLIDHSGNMVIADTGNSLIRKVAQPTIMREGEIVFPESRGVGHVISGSRLHTRTVDLATGADLYAFGYNENNRLVSITDQFGNQTTIQRGLGGVPTAILSPDGLKTDLTVDGNNHLTRVSYPDGVYYSFAYTSDGLLTEELEPNGNRFDHEYDENGRLIEISDEEGGFWEYGRTFDANGDIITRVASAEGNETVYADHTDSNGKFTSTITGPDGSLTAYERSADELSVQKTLACGMDLDIAYGVDPEFKYKYPEHKIETSPSGLARSTTRDRSYTDTDDDGNFESVTDIISVNGESLTVFNDILRSEKVLTTPEGRSIAVNYDPQTLLTTNLSIPGLFDTSFFYDDRGRLTDILAGSRRTTLAYNTNSFIASITDPENNITTFATDDVGRVTAVHRPDFTDLYFHYDPNGSLTILRNPENVDHGFDYSGTGLLQTYQTPFSGSYSWVYDKDRRMIQMVFPSGMTMDMDYTDPVGGGKSRLMSVRTPEGNIDFTYMCGSKVESITNGPESIAYGYDGSLVTGETLAGTLNQSLEYTYNNRFDVGSFTYAGGTETYAYDDDGLLTGAGSFSIIRNAENGLPEEVGSGNLSLVRQFNGHGEIQSVQAAINSQNVWQWSVTRNNSGQITQKTETVGGTTTVFDYEYDEMGRLERVIRDDVQAEAYQYNMNGARAHEVNTLRGIAGRSFTYSDEDHLLSTEDADFTYDLDGFLTAKIHGSEATFYDYSARGELLSVDLPDGTRIEYIHDPLGRRIAKKVDGTTVEKYLWQGLTRLLAVYDGSNNLIMRFNYADSRMPFSVEMAGETYYLAYNQVGSLRMVADSLGNVIKAKSYDSFGNVISDTNPSLAVPFGFAGGLSDMDTGLIRFGFRDYDPDTGRWTAKDPIFFAGGDSDLYGYCLNDPINFNDYQGLKFYGAANAGFLGYDYSTNTQNLSQASVTTGNGVIIGGSLSVGYDFGEGIFGEIIHDLLGEDSLNLGLGEYLGITVAPDLSKIQLNIGLGLALPASYTVPIRDGNLQPVDATFGDDLYDFLHDDPCK